MTDIEQDVYNAVNKALKAKFGEEIRVIGEIMDAPKVYPTVYIQEVSNTIYYPRWYGENGNDPEVTVVWYEAQVYTTGNGKRSKAKKIMAVINKAMFSLGFRQRINEALPPIDNASVSRRVGRWRGLVKQNLTEQNTERIDIYGG